jgi:hypothetical protein
LGRRVVLASAVSAASSLWPCLDCLYPPSTLPSCSILWLLLICARSHLKRPTSIAYSKELACLLKSPRTTPPLQPELVSVVNATGAADTIRRAGKLTFPKPSLSSSTRLSSPELAWARQRPLSYHSCSNRRLARNLSFCSFLHSSSLKMFRYAAYVEHIVKYSCFDRRIASGRWGWR